MERIFSDRSQIAESTLVHFGEQKSLFREDNVKELI